MRNMARDYPSLKGIQIEGYIGNEELQRMYDVTFTYFGE